MRSASIAWCAASSSARRHAGAARRGRSCGKTSASHRRRRREIEAGLPAAEQLEIDLGQEPAIDLGAVLVADRQVDREAAAQRVEAGRRAREAAARQRRACRQRGRRAAGRPSRASSALRKARSNSALWMTSRSPPIKASSSSAIAANGGWLGEELGGDAVHRERFLRHVALGIDVAVEFAPGRDVVHQLDAGDLDDAMPVIRVEPGGFGVEHDLAHHRLLATGSPRYRRRRTQARRLRRGPFP